MATLSRKISSSLTSLWSAWHSKQGAAVAVRKIQMMQQTLWMKMSSPVQS